MSRSLEKVIEFLTESHLDTYGGYPYDYEIHDDYLFVAELDDGKERAATLLKKYPIAALEAWYKEARKFKAEYKEDWTCAFFETMPKVCQ